MAVIIENMEIPRSCSECNLCSNQGLDRFYCDVTTSYVDIESEERASDCPLKEVPTGKWIRKYDSIINSYYWQCNQCEHDNEHKSNYCPNCGSRMVEEQTGKKTDDNA